MIPGAVAKNFVTIRVASQHTEVDGGERWKEFGSSRSLVVDLLTTSKGTDLSRELIYELRNSLNI